VIALRRVGVAGALLLVLSAMALRAQDTASVPRPTLALGADSNSAQANYKHGVETVRANPAEAVRAFNWAARLDPSSGDALYALRAAKILAMSPKELQSYVTQQRSKRSPEQLWLDSLVVRAYAIDPFVFCNFDIALAERMKQAEILAANPKIEPWMLQRVVTMHLQLGSNWAWLLYTQGRFNEALDAYAKELHLQPVKFKDKKINERAEKIHSAKMLTFHAERGRIFFMVDSLDSARAEITTAIDGMRAIDESKDPTILYQSKAMLMQSLGMIEERAHHPQQARAAYSAALQEDLAFYAAHTRLAQLALADNDTTSALAEMDLAVQLAPGDPALRYRYADALVHARRDGDAAAQLRKAIALDPWYGAPHLLLARIADVEQYTDDAIDEYRKYLAVASRTDYQYLVAKERLSKLTSTVASSQAKQ
jgi:tetratricopeptide (TPR) repeat protein